MKVLVVLRAVVDAADELPIVDGHLDEDSLQYTPNEFDEYALEEALYLQAANGATVIAVAPAAAGPRILHTALARGANAAVSLDVALPSIGASFAFSAALAELARQLGADLVLTGVQAPDDIFGQLAPLLAARLKWPQASGVGSVEQTADGRVGAVQDVEGGRSNRVTITLPAVLGVQSSRQAPRYVSATKLKQVMQGGKIETRAAPPHGDGAPNIVSIARPHSASRVQMLSDDPEEAAIELAAILSAAGA